MVRGGLRQESDDDDSGIACLRRRICIRQIIHEVEELFFFLLGQRDLGKGRLCWKFQSHV